jgi:DNA-binding transcriptional MerR regulator
MSNGVITYTLKVNAKDGTATLEKVGSKFDQIGGKGAAGSKKAGKGMDALFDKTFKLNQALEFAQKAYHMLSGPIGDFVSRASDAQEISSKFLAVFKTEAPAATAFISKLSDDLNRSKTDLRDWMGSFQDTFVPIGFARNSARELSQQLTALTIDLSSFYNRAEPEVILDLNSALVGNHETMKKYGVILTQNTLNQELLTMGVRGGIKAATEQEKVMARVNLIMKGTADAHRDAIRTADQFANMSRGFSAIWKDIQEVVGTAIIDAIIPYMKDLAAWTKENRDKIEAFAKKAGEAIGNFLTHIIEVGKALWKYKDEIIAVGKLILQIFVVKKVLDFGKGIMNLVGGVKDLVGKLGGLNSMVAKVGAGFAAFGAGWAIGDFINDITGLQKATAQLHEWEMKLEYSLARVRTGLTDSSVQNAKYTQQIKDISAELGTKTASLHKSAAAIFQNKEAYEKLSPELRKIVDGFLKSNQQIQENIKKTEEANKKAEEAKKKEEALTKAKEAARIASQKERIEIEKYAEKLKLVSNVNEDLEKKTRILISAINMSGETWISNKDAVENISKEVKALIESYQFAGKAIPPELEKVWTQVKLNQENQSIFNEKIEKFGELNSDIYVPGMGNMQESTDLTRKSIEAAKDMTMNFMESLEFLYGIALEGIGVFSQFIGVLGQFGIISEGAVSAINSAISNITGGLDSILGGIESMTKEGASFFDILSGGLSAISGIGAIAKTVIGGIISLFTGDGIQEAIDRENSWMNLNKQLNDSIHQLAEEIGSTHAATSLFLTDILQESLSFETFDQFADRIRDIQCDVMAGVLSQQEANQAMGESFEILAQKAREYGKEGSFYMLQIIRQNRDMGLNIAEINDYVLEKLNAHVTALNTYLDTMTGSFAENAGFLEANILSVFGAFEKEGYSFLEIVSFMGDSFTTLKEKAQAEGVQVSGAIQEMIDLSDFISQNQTLFQNIEATKQMMTSLGDSAYLNEELFKSFGHEAVSQFGALIAAGAKEKDALRILGPELSQLIKYAESYGFAIEGETAALIEKAATEGALNAQSMSDSEKQRVLLEEIVKLLGGDIPYAVSNLTGQVRTSMDSIAGETGKWGGGLQDIVGNIQDVEGALRSLDTTNTQVVSGNTILNEWFKFQMAVIETDQDIKNIKPTLRMLDTEFQDALPVIQSVFAGFQQSTWDWEKKLKDVQVAMATASSSEMPELQGKYNEILTGMNADTLMFKDYLLDIVSQIGIEIPAEMTNMQDIYSLVMQNMTSATGGYKMSADGVLMTLNQIIVKQSQALANQSGFGSGWGVYTEEEKIQKTTEFKAMARQWADNRALILSDESYMKNFLNKIQSYKDAITDDYKGQYDRFAASMKQWYSHLEKGEVWNESTLSWIKPIAAASGFDGEVRKPTFFLAGEDGEEHVRITPKNQYRHSTHTPKYRHNETNNYYISVTVEGDNENNDIIHEIVDGIKRNRHGIRGAFKDVAREVVGHG